MMPPHAHHKKDILSKGSICSTDGCLAGATVTDDASQRLDLVGPRDDHVINNDIIFNNENLAASAINVSNISASVN